jgi:hypothetical protein
LVFQLQLRNRFRLPALIGVLATALSITSASADSATAQEYLRNAQSYYHQGLYFKAARYAFAASDEDPGLRAEAYSWITLGLSHAGLYNASTYFFIRTLQTGNKAAIRRVLPLTEEYLLRFGGDLFRPYLIRHTAYEDYDPVTRGSYLYQLGKDAILAGDDKRAIGYLNAIRTDSPMWPYALEMRATAFAIAGQNDHALEDFRSCEKQASSLTDDLDKKSPLYVRTKRDAADLQARCYAGEARTLYQMDQFELADWTYDRIPKASLVWPDILFEQAWNSFGKEEYNRTLGKLVSYKSPALNFVFNSEVDVLRAQTYLSLCLYNDANETINEFNSKYTQVGETVKHFVESNRSNLPAFYEQGKQALHAPLYTSNDMYRLENRFVRSPYFQNLTAAEQDLFKEKTAIARFNTMETGHDRNSGFVAFLGDVLGWRLKTIRLLGGSFVKNSLLDYHQQLISDFEKMAFIKLEMLRRAKDQLLYKNKSQLANDRSRGNVIPSRRDDQFYWTFNGEFWNDELGDYVFGLESECTKDNNGA